MKAQVCKVCGGEIIVEFVTPTKVFRAAEEGTFEKINSIADEDPDFLYVCELDREHDLGDSEELLDFMDEAQTWLLETGMVG